MPRKKTEAKKIGQHGADSMKTALELVRGGLSLKEASRRTSIPYSTLKRYHDKTKNSSDLSKERLEPNYTVNLIFTAVQEKTLKEYFVYCADMFYGLTAKECRKIAYDTAIINKVKMPPSWEANHRAGKDWLTAFKKRHNLSLKRPEPCSLARATSFNKRNVDSFYDNLESLMKRFPAFADGTRIFNLDETSTTTVHKPPKVVATKGKSVGKVTSAERGILLTTCCIISAVGFALPPVIVFPRKNFKDHMIKNTPAGTLGLASSTGWMNSSIFPEVIKHFIKFTNSTPENPCLLIMDNHESHLCIEGLNLAKNSGVHILTLHPHTSAKLQPLDVGVYGPFKVYYNAALDSWLIRNPGKPITIYDLGEVIGSAFQKAMTPRNITHAFEKCGIFPFDRHIFTDSDYLPSSVTDRPCPDCEIRDEGAAQGPAVTEMHQTELNQTTPSDLIIEPSDPTPGPSNRMSSASNPMPGPSGVNTHSIIAPSVLGTRDQNLAETDVVQLMKEGIKTPEIASRSVLAQNVDRTSPTIFDYVNTLDSSSACEKIVQPTPEDEHSSKKTSSFTSPFQFRDPIKAGPRISNRKRRKPRRSIIATDTPEKQQLEQEKNASKLKCEAKSRKISRKVLTEDSDEEKDEEVLLDDTTDDEYDSDNNENVSGDVESSKVVLLPQHLNMPLPRPPVEGEYVVVEFSTKKQTSYFIGKIIEGRNENMEYFVSFLQRKIGTYKFHGNQIYQLLKKGT